jgi:hypothetical protein
VRTIWTILSVLAVANLLALGAFVAWLGGTDRLDASRVREVRAVFSQTLTQKQVDEAAAKAKEEADLKAAADKAKSELPPVTAADTLAIKLEQSKADTERMEALRREVRILQETLRRERQALEDDKLALKKEREEFERARTVVAETEGNAQFKKTLATYEGLKADQAKLALQELIDRKEVDQVVAYLNAMQERTRTKIINEFISADPKVATDLLERLRMRGLLASAPEEPPG